MRQLVVKQIRGPLLVGRVQPKKPQLMGMETHCSQRGEGVLTPGTHPEGLHPLLPREALGSIVLSLIRNQKHGH